MTTEKPQLSPITLNQTEYKPQNVKTSAVNRVKVIFDLLQKKCTDPDKIFRQGNEIIVGKNHVDSDAIVPESQIVDTLLLAAKDMARILVNKKELKVIQLNSGSSVEEYQVRLSDEWTLKAENITGNVSPDTGNQKHYRLSILDLRPASTPPQETKVQDPIGDITQFFSKLDQLQKAIDDPLLHPDKSGKTEFAIPNMTIPFEQLDKLQQSLLAHDYCLLSKKTDKEIVWTDSEKSVEIIFHPIESRDDSPKKYQIILRQGTEYESQKALEDGKNEALMRYLIRILPDSISEPRIIELYLNSILEGEDLYISHNVIGKGNNPSRFRLDWEITHKINAVSRQKLNKSSKIIALLHQVRSME